MLIFILWLLVNINCRLTLACINHLAGKEDLLNYRSIYQINVDLKGLEPNLRGDYGV